MRLGDLVRSLLGRGPDRRTVAHDNAMGFLDRRKDQSGPNLGRRASDRGQPPPGPPDRRSGR